MARKVLIWYWSKAGAGGSRFAVRLARRLAGMLGAEGVTLSLHADDPALREACADPTITTRAAQVFTSRRNAIGTVAALGAGARVLAEHAKDADCVVVPMNFAVASALCNSLKQPLVYCAHDPTPHPGDYAMLEQVLTQAVLLRRATRVVALSEHGADMLRRDPRIRAKLVVAPLNSVLEPRAPSARLPGPVRFLFAGRLIGYKGLDLLAEALRTLRQRQDWRLIVAGDGPALAPALEARFRLPQVEPCRRGWLDHAALEALIAECDVLLAPYRSATQSGVIAEALAQGKPCVVTPVGALPEQIGAGAAGWIAESVSAPAFAAAMASALDDAQAWADKALAAHALARAAWSANCWDWLREL